jgi:hypothetical protein
VKCAVEMVHLLMLCCSVNFTAVINLLLCSSNA